MVTVRTRAEPMPARDGRTFHVYPHGFTRREGAAGVRRTDVRVQPVLLGHRLRDDRTAAREAGRHAPGARRPLQVQPLRVHDEPVGQQHRSRSTARTTSRPTARAERPIAIKAAGDGEVIFDGNGNFALFDVRAADYTYFEGITFRNAEYGILAGTQFLLGSKGLTVKRSRFENVGAGVWTNYSGSSNFYIADNVFIGRDDPDHVIGWSGAMWQPFNGVDGQKFPPAMASYVAVKVYGPGHVVAHNYVANFHDGIDIETYGNPGRLGGRRRPGVSAARACGTCGRSASTSTTTS